MTPDLVASIFGMPPRVQLQQDPHKALDQIMRSGMPPETVARFMPSQSALEQNDASPSAVSILHTISSEYGVDCRTASRWLVEHADEFKTLYESKK